jgi:hypothetical protein
MPSSDQGTNLTYTNANTLISGDLSRSGCVSFRASASNADNIIFSIGSSLTTASGGCDTNFALSVINASHVTIYGMCPLFDNPNIPVGQSILYDGAFHQVCVTYDNTISTLCVYLDLLSPQCLIRSNAPYNTSLGDVRIGWWPDNNRQFVASGGGLIELVSLFNVAINQSCVAFQYQVNNMG